MSGSTNRSSLNHQVWHTQNFLQNIRILDKIFNFITQRLSGRRQLSDLKYYQVTKYSNNNFRFAQNLGALILSLQNLHNLSPVLQIWIGDLAFIFVTILAFSYLYLIFELLFQYVGDVEQWPDFGCEGIKVQRAHQPTSQCWGGYPRKQKLLFQSSLQGFVCICIVIQLYNILYYYSFCNIKCVLFQYGWMFVTPFKLNLYLGKKIRFIYLKHLLFNIFVEVSASGEFQYTICDGVFMII
eukprot:TRINITY_DN7821_c0_g1_i4.p2 TRINITY_DN7821_c0_g1~~TRINITY_DN7821_c0_g1_i4.p2  ORF type:complete len:240 (-),score=5.69 TRINITY_DN7821_c0_g1_i4:1551-2270(-)